MGGKDTTPNYGIVADPYKDIREPTMAWLKSQIGQSAPQYTGELVAPATGQEKQSLDFLDKYVNQGSSEGMKLANEEVKKTMTDQYDPTTSGYYNAVKAESAKNLADTQKQIADQAAGGGRFWGGARLKEQGTASNDAAIAMNKLLYGMSETERARRLATVPVAAELGKYAEAQPLQKATALQSLGSLDRTLNQARDEAIYNEWLRATQEYPLQIGSLASSMSKEPYYAQTTKSGGGNTSLLGGGMGALIGALLAAPTGGMSIPMGALIGGGLGTGAGSFFN
jgi:hypothetical protein